MLPESLNDAYIEAIKQLGGSKAVGIALWPSKGVDAAQRHLLACMNPDRNEKLGPDECLHIERLARDRGCHIVAQYRNAALSYAEPQPIEPKDEADELRRQFIETGKLMARMAEKIEALERVGLRVAA